MCAWEGHWKVWVVRFDMASRSLYAWLTKYTFYVFVQKQNVFGLINDENFLGNHRVYAKR